MQGGVMGFGAANGAEVMCEGIVSGMIGIVSKVP